VLAGKAEGWGKEQQRGDEAEILSHRAFALPSKNIPAMSSLISAK